MPPFEIETEDERLNRKECQPSRLGLECARRADNHSDHAVGEPRFGHGTRRTQDMYVRKRVPWMRPKTTPTCSKGCARPDGRANAVRVLRLTLAGTALSALLRKDKLCEETSVGQAALKVAQAEGVVVGLA